MAAPQPGILMEEKAHALFLVLRARTGVDGRELLRACAKAPRLSDVVARRDKKAALRCTVAFGRRLLESAAGSSGVPKQFHEFVPIRTVGGEVPRTPADVLFHIGSNRHDLNFELARTLLAKVGELVSAEEEVAGFRYLDGRDLTGFIDGTANPKGRARAEAALIGPEDKSFAGGSFVLIQRYVHNLTAWSRLSQRDQEAAIGRTKKDSIELPGNRKLPTAHMSRVEINGTDGEELKIVRHSFPYGVASGENGLFFIAYAKDSAIFQAMLARMFGAGKDGLSDRLMDFTKPLTGAILFAPSLAMLRQMAR